MEGDIREQLSQNLVTHRKRKGWTQAELGERIRYSDKSISKWERGEGIPDIYVLSQLADMYDTSIDALIGRAASAEIDRSPNADDETATAQVQRTEVQAILLSLFMQICGVWLVAVIVFTALLLLWPAGRAWLAFLYATPVSLAALGATCLRLRVPSFYAFIAFSAVMWVGACAVQLTFFLTNAYLVYISAVVAQLIAFLFYTRRRQKHLTTPYLEAPPQTPAGAPRPCTRARD